jgi:hypothetical protein
MAFNREAAKAEGYTDEEIDAYLQQQSGQKKEPTTISIDDLPAPTTVIQEPGTSAASVATTAGLAAAPYVLPAAGAAAAAVGGSKLYGAWNASAQAAKALADAKMASEQGIAQRAAMKMNPQMARPGPANFGPGTAMPTQPYQAPVSGPVVPQAAPASAPAVAQQTVQQTARQSMADKVRQLAAQRIIPVMGQAGEMAGQALSKAAPLLRGANIAGSALYSGELNSNEQAELERRRRMPPTITR